MSDAPERIWTIDTGWSGSWSKDPTGGTEYIRADIADRYKTTLQEMVNDNGRGYRNWGDFAIGIKRKAAAALKQGEHG